VSSHALYATGCSTPSTDFSNSGSLTLEGNFLYAELANNVLGAVYTFCLKVRASTSFIDVTTLEFVVCSPLTITSGVVPIVVKQIVTVGDADMTFKIPEFANSMSTDGCPTVSKHSLYATGCSNPSTDFSNAGSLTAVGGILKALLAVKTVAKDYIFCLKVEASSLFITAPSLVLKVCPLPIIRAPVAIIL